MEWASEQYKKQKDSWVPWIEDMYLYYFTKDNKASYATKGESPYSRRVAFYPEQMS